MIGDAAPDWRRGICLFGGDFDDGLHAGQYIIREVAFDLMAFRQGPHGRHVFFA